jgi:hypothetical protein
MTIGDHNVTKQASAYRDQDMRDAAWLGLHRV